MEIGTERSENKENKENKDTENKENKVFTEQNENPVGNPEREPSREQDPERVCELQVAKSEGPTETHVREDKNEVSKVSEAYVPNGESVCGSAGDSVSDSVCDSVCDKVSDKVSGGRENSEKKNSGLFVYAAAVTVAFAVCLALLAGALLEEKIPARRTIFVRRYDSESGILTTPEIFGKVSPSVVTVRNTRLSPSGEKTVSIGTGIVVLDGNYVLTNEHVVEGSVSCRVVTADKKSIDAVIAGSDPLSDVALLYLGESGLKPAEIGNSDELLPGEKVVAIGTPGKPEFAETVTEGIVSGINRHLKVRDEKGEIEKNMIVIQTTASVNRGNSGGPLLNEKGEVVGIVFMKMKPGFDDIGFALPVNGVMKLITQIKKNGSVKDGSSEIAYKPVQIGISACTAERGKEIKLDDGTTVTPIEDGVCVIEVFEGCGAADKLAAGDLIIEIDGAEIRSSEDVIDKINEKRAGEKVSVRLIRDGEYLLIDTELCEK